MLHRTDAIVLKTSSFSEADLIVSHLTSDYGLLKTFAKSPRKIKSRFGSSLEPLTYSRISFWGKEDANLPRLTQSDIIRSFQSLRDNVRVFFGATGMIELILNLLPEREPNHAIFSLLREVLERLEECCGVEDTAADISRRLAVLFRIRFLDITGYGPALGGCARCGRKGFDFYLSHGSIICAVCAGGQDAPLRLSPGVMKLYETLRKWEVSKIERVRPTGALLSELDGLLDAHLQYTIARPLKVRPLAPK